MKWKKIKGVAATMVAVAAFLSPMKKQDVLKAQAPIVEMCYIRESVVERLKSSTVLVRTTRGYGSGVVIKVANGRSYILTNKHVALSGEGRPVIFNEGRFFITRNIYLHPAGLDLAILEVDGYVGKPAEIARYTPRVGVPVVVVGSPLRMEDSFTTGIVSGIRVRNGAQLLQTDAAVNPGNSGGGIFTKEGKLLAITTFKLLRTPLDDAEGVAFGIMVNNLPPLHRWVQQ